MTCTVGGIERTIRIVLRAILLAVGFEDHARRSSRVRPAVCVDCGARDLEHFYTARVGGSTLCEGCFQRRVECGAAREADSFHP